MHKNQVLYSDTIIEAKPYLVYNGYLLGSMVELGRFTKMMRRKKKARLNRKFIRRQSHSIVAELKNETRE